MDVKQKRIYEIKLDIQELKNRLMRWAKSEDFNCVNESSTKWVFKRGSHWHALYTFNIKKIPTEVVVELKKEEPSRINCSLHCKTWFSLETPGDKKRISNQLDILAKYLNG